MWTELNAAETTVLFTSGSPITSHFRKSFFLGWGVAGVRCSTSYSLANILNTLHVNKSNVNKIHNYTKKLKGTQLRGQIQK